MTKKLYIALQTPSVEMKIKSEPDCSGKTSTLTAVFVRHDNQDADKYREKFLEIQNRVYVSESERAEATRKVTTDYSFLEPEELAERVARADASLIDGKTLGSDEDAKILRDRQVSDLRAFVKSQIIALKDVPLEVEETDETTGKVSMTTLKVPDTRTATKNEELWGDAENCLSALLDALLLSNPWSSSLIRALHKVFYNLNLGADAEVKN